MPVFKLPLSGNVTQSINPWNVFFNPVGSQIGLVNINLGNSANPAVEEEVLTDVASYGKQLGKIEDVLAVLLAHFNPKQELREHEKQAISELRLLLDDVTEVKKRHARNPGSSGRSRDAVKEVG